MTRICLDAGHGGRDPGAIGPTGLREANVNLAVALEAAPRLGDAALLIRADDRFIELGHRARIANDAGADCFISIHCNSFTSAAAHGTETFAFAAASGGAPLAAALQRLLLAALGRANRGVKFANFQVLRETRMPAALCELAFISNPEEERLLSDPAFQARAGAAIAEAAAGFAGLVSPEA